jgi:hypothetical protein
MNVNTAANILLIAAAVIWILAKQVKAAPVKPRLLVLAPLIMGYFGIKDTPASTWKTGADLGYIVVGALLSIGLGLWRGTTIRVWREQDGGWWRAGTKYTLYLWGALLVVRAVLAGAAGATGHKAADGLGPILFSLALSFAAQNAVIGMRMSGAPAIAPAQGGPMPVPGSAPVDLGQYGQYDNQAGYGQPVGFGQTGGYEQTSAYPQRADSLHDRREQRRAARRARRAERWDR